MVATLVASTVDDLTVPTSTRSADRNDHEFTNAKATVQNEPNPMPYVYDVDGPLLKGLSPNDTAVLGRLVFADFSVPCYAMGFLIELCDEVLTPNQRQKQVADIARLAHKAIIAGYDLRPTNPRHELAAMTLIWVRATDGQRCSQNSLRWFSTSGDEPKPNFESLLDVAYESALSWVNFVRRYESDPRTQLQRRLTALVVPQTKL